MQMRGYRGVRSHFPCPLCQSGTLSSASAFQSSATLPPSRHRTNASYSRPLIGLNKLMLFMCPNWHHNRKERLVKLPLQPSTAGQHTLHQYRRYLWQPGGDPDYTQINQTHLQSAKLWAAWQSNSDPQSEVVFDVSSMARFRQLLLPSGSWSAHS
eukprot:956250-Rhodomonas_salina.2